MSLCDSGNDLRTPNGDAPNWGNRIEINQATDWDRVDLQVTRS